MAKKALLEQSWTLTRQKTRDRPVIPERNVNFSFSVAHRKTGTRIFFFFLFPRELNGSEGGGVR
jgi:hypothetical protein